jgi:hypothetical protein
VQDLCHSCHRSQLVVRVNSDGEESVLGNTSCFLTPPSEPGVRLSPHRALPLSVHLSLSPMTWMTERLEILREVGGLRLCIASLWATMVHFRCPL